MPPFTLEKDIQFVSLFVYSWHWGIEELARFNRSKFIYPDIHYVYFSRESFEWTEQRVVEPEDPVILPLENIINLGIATKGNEWVWLTRT